MVKEADLNGDGKVDYSGKINLFCLGLVTKGGILLLSLLLFKIYIHFHYCFPLFKLTFRLLCYFQNSEQFFLRGEHKINYQYIRKTEKIVEHISTLTNCVVEKTMVSVLHCDFWTAHQIFTPFILILYIYMCFMHNTHICWISTRNIHCTACN